MEEFREVFNTIQGYVTNQTFLKVATYALFTGAICFGGIAIKLYFDLQKKIKEDETEERRLEEIARNN